MAKVLIVIVIMACWALAAVVLATIYSMVRYYEKMGEDQWNRFK